MQSSQALSCLWFQVKNPLEYICARMSRKQVKTNLLFLCKLFGTLTHIAIAVVQKQSSRLRKTSSKVMQKSNKRYRQWFHHVSSFWLRLLCFVPCFACVCVFPENEEAYLPAAPMGMWRPLLQSLRREKLWLRTSSVALGVDSERDGRPNEEVWRPHGELIMICSFGRFFGEFAHGGVVFRLWGSLWKGDELICAQLWTVFRVVCLI